MCIYGNTYVYTYVYLCIHILALTQHICIYAHAYHDIIILGLIVPRVLFGLACVAGGHLLNSDLLMIYSPAAWPCLGISLVWLVFGRGHLPDSDLL